MKYATNYTMNYKKYVLDVFKHYYNNKVDQEEINKFIQETEFTEIEKFLTTLGYDLTEMYYNHLGVLSKANKEGGK